MMSSGYSGTPLAKKLGLKKGVHAIFYQCPEHYFDLFLDFPEEIQLLEERKAESADFIHVFFYSEKEFKEYIHAYIAALKKDGTLWVSWPKKSSRIKTDLVRDSIREHILTLGLVDVKVAAVDKDWSGLKFMYRIVDR